MPIYEWQCREGHVFEMLARADAAKRRQSCPSCGAKSERVISPVAIHAGVPIQTASERAAARDLDVTGVKLPNVARLCGMDDYSATRLAAHKLGRGNEFDDKMATRNEQQASRGEAPKKKTAAHKHKHSH
jgi:putative FmdB family regulatory protein